MFVKHVCLKNLLSFGPEEMPVDLKPLNVLIGPNGSGKSNFLEVFELLRNASGEIAKPIRQGGGISDWLWKNGGGGPSEARVDIVIDYPPRRPQAIRYGLSFTEVASRFEMLDERIENDQVDPGSDQLYFYYRYNESGRPMISINCGSNLRSLQCEDVALDKSLLAQRRDPDQFPEITYLGKKFEEISLFREWSFGRYAEPRLPQKTDLPNIFLLSDASNLGLVLNRLRREPGVKLQLLEALRQLYEGIDDYEVLLEGGTVQIFFQEGRRIIPATRLSDGTLRYLSLLTILLHPSPPPLICIEEPEWGLHPDIIPTLVRLLQEASTRTQLIVTTHSDSLVDAFTETPEVVLVCERAEESGTIIKRLDADELKPWLEKYRLGHLWLGGYLGGVRW
ncbi:MAG: AAA family ATPase [Deltaproteobacteria bacterium]|jgi:predicted ATPase|nr:AAA family ATPase [Deltaproteobacteria bacterium]